MKQLLLILFILISFNVCYSSEINKNICPVADLQYDILKSFFIEKKKETYKDVFSGENVTEFKYYYDVNFNNKKQVDIMYNLVKYYDNTIHYLYNINCFDFTIKFLVEKKSIISFPTYSKKDKTNLMNSLQLYYNSLLAYNKELSKYNKHYISVYNNKPICETVECFKEFTKYNKLYK